MRDPEFGESKPAAKLQTVAKRMVYALVVFDVLLIVAAGAGYMPLVLFIVLYWASGLGIVGTIHTVEDDVHPEQRGWWTLLPLALGGFGLLAWLRHLDREH